MARRHSSIAGRTSRLKSRLQTLFGIDQAAVALVHGERLMIDNGGFCKQFLSACDGLDHLLRLRLQVMALVHHVGDIGLVPGFPFEETDLVEDAEDLIRIDGAQGQIVVGKAAVVQMKAAQHAVIEEPGYDLLDVLGLVMMAGIHQDCGLRPGGLREPAGPCPNPQYRCDKKRARRVCIR